MSCLGSQKEGPFSGQKNILWVIEKRQTAEGVCGYVLVSRFVINGVVVSTKGESHLWRCEDAIVGIPFVSPRKY